MRRISTRTLTNRGHRRVRPKNVRQTLTTQGAEIGPYGLKRVDYSIPPPTWPMPPPPPPPKSLVRQYLPFVTGFAFFAGVAWVVSTKDESVYDYWKQVEQGKVPIDLDDDDDDDDDLDDLDDDEDEWPELKK